MATDRQIEANRRNAQKSTGPTSVTGKVASALNALKSGIHAESVVLPSESAEDLEELTIEFYRQYQPATPDARSLVDDLVFCEWSLRRFRAAEAQMVQYQNENRYSGPRENFPLGHSATSHAAQFSRLHYRLNTTRRAYLRIREELKLLQAAAPAEPLDAALEATGPALVTHSSQTSSHQIGFVPSTTVSTPSEPAPSPAPQARTGLQPYPQPRTTPRGARPYREYSESLQTRDNRATLD